MTMPPASVPPTGPPPTLPPSPPRRWWRLPALDWRAKARWFAAEIVVVVAGVLIALGAQAVVQERADRRAEQAFLDDLLDEFRVNEARLLSDIDITGRAVAAGERWRTPGSARSESAPDPYAASLLTARFDPVSGTLRSLIDGGDLDLVRDRELRAALAGWTDRTQEQVLTSVTVVTMRAALVDVLVAEGPSAPEAALDADLLLLRAVHDQQTDLLSVVRETIAMLEREQDR